MGGGSDGARCPAVLPGAIGCLQAGARITARAGTGGADRGPPLPSSSLLEVRAAAPGRRQ